MLNVTRQVWLEMIAEAWRVYPHEACGLILGPPGGADPARATRFVAVKNAACSSRVFELDGLGFMKAERTADDAGLAVIGVMHSHSHTAAYPSPTDQAEAAKPLAPDAWHWVIVSLAWGEPEVRSFAARPGGGSASGIAEEPLVLSD